MILKSRRPLLLAAVLMLATPATFATAQAASPHHHGESLQHRQAAQCGHMHGHARHSCEVRVSHDWNRHHH
jgi:hypothetical protein